MNELVKILERYNINGSEKKRGTDKESRHSYTQSYIDLFSKFKDKETTFLEIGNCFGASILLWQKFLPKTHVYAVDILFRMGKLSMDHIDVDRWTWFIGDAYSEVIKTNIMKKSESFDIILDDGPHSIESQVSSLRLYLPILKSGGVFVIEDIQDLDNDIELLIDVVNKFDNCTYEIIDLRSNKDIYDDVLFVVNKN